MRWARGSYKACIAIACSSIVAILVRWPQIDESLWLDELHTAWCVSGSWSDIASRARIGNHSPVYFFLSRTCVAAFGASELTLRLPSLVAGLLLIPAAGALVWQWTRSFAASFLVALLLAIDPVCIFYSQEARPYACLQLLSCCHLAVVWKLSREPGISLRAAFVAGAVLLFYLHYTAALFILGEAVCLFILAIRRGADSKYALRHLAIDLLLIGLGCLLAFRQIESILLRRQDWQSFVPEPSWAGLVSLLKLHVYFLWLLLGAVVAWLWTRHRDNLAWHWPDATGLGLAASAVLIPLTIAWFVTETFDTRLLFRRYLLPSYVAAIVLSVSIWSALPAGWLRATTALLTIGSLIWTSGMPQQFARNGGLLADRRQDWRGAVRYVNENADDLDTALVRSGFLEADQLRQPHLPLLDEYCLAPVNSLYQLAIPAIPLATTSPADMEFVQRNLVQPDEPRVIWFMINGNTETRRKFVLETRERFQRSGIKIESGSVRNFGDVMVWKGTLSPRRPAP